MLEHDDSSHAKAPDGQFSSARSRALLRGAFIFLVYLLAFIMLDSRAHALEVFPGIVAWYPPDGLSFALLLTLGALSLPWLAIASLISSLFVFQFSLPLSALIGWAILVALAFGLAAWFLKQRVRFDTQLRSPQDLIWLMATTAVVSAVLGAVSVSAAIASGAVPPAEGLWAAVQWWIGEMIGVLILAPVLLIHVMPHVKRFLEGAALIPKTPGLLARPSLSVILQGLSILAAIYLAVDVSWPNGFHPFFLVAMPMVWIAIKHGLSGASVGNLLVNFGMTWAVQTNHSFNLTELGQLQLILLVVTMTSLLIGIFISEQKRSLSSPVTEVEQQRNKVTYELILISIAAMAAWVLEYTFDFYEAINEWETRHQIKGLDEALITLLVLGVASAIFSYRRWREVQAEVHERERAQAELQSLYRELEVRVRERTADLSKANELLQAEVTEHEQTEQALRESEQRFRHLFTTSPDALLLIDPHSTHVSWSITDCNDAACQMNGYPREEMIGQSIDLLNSTPGVRAERVNYLERLRQDKVIHIEAFHRHKDGHIFPVEVSSSLLILGGRELVLGIDRDITERRQAETALKNAEAKYRILVEQLPAVIYIVEYGEITNPSYVSPQIESMLGFSAQEWLDNPDLWANQLHPEDRERVLAEFDLRDRLNQPIDIDYRILTRAGEVRWIHDQSRLILDETGARFGHGLIFDITERKNVEESLAQSERRFRALIENSADAITLLDSHGTVIYDSPAAPGMLGYDPEERIGENTFELLHPDDLKTIQPAFQSLIQTPGARSNNTFRVRHKNGSWRWIEAVVTNLLAEPSVKAIVANYQDITERMEAESKIRSRTEELAALYELSRALAGASELDDVLELVNRWTVESMHATFARILLLEADEFVVRSVYPIRALDHELLVGSRKSIRGMPYCERVLEQDEPVILSTDQTEVAGEERGLLLLDFAQTLCLIPLRVYDFVTNSTHNLGLLMVGEARKEEREPFTPEKLRMARSISDQAAIAIENTRLFSDLQRSNIELRLAYDATITGWSAALDLRDKETEGHTQRVTELTLRLAAQMGFSGQELVHVRRGALLHDIGKMGVPDRILLKPDQLTEEEWVRMRKHPTYAYDMLKPIAYLAPALDIPYCHHEKWDGTGYPRGLQGEAIPIAARIFAVVDVYDALTSDRPYRTAWSQEKTLQYIRDLSGSHFDPDVVDVFLKLVEEDR